MSHKKKLGAKKVSLYVLFKPAFVKMFTYTVLLVIAFNGYHLFHTNLTSYEEFLTLMDDPLLVDIKFVNSSEKCPSHYKEIHPTTFSNTYDGCICNGNILKTTQCKMLSVPNPPPRGCEFSDIDGLTQNFTNSCSLCYNNVTGLRQNFTLSLFYDGVKPCLLYDEEQTTLSYLKSAEYECEEGNVCNEYFCKKDNNHSKLCPITTLTTQVRPILPFMHDWKNETGPFKFSDTYKKYYNYDSNNYDYIYAPIIGIYSSKEAICVDDSTLYTSKYPLINIHNCQESILFDNFDSRTSHSVIKSNGFESQIYDNLPWFEFYSQKEVWYLSSKTAFRKDTLYCLINRNNLQIKNLLDYLNHHPHLDSEHLKHIEHVKEEFRELTYVYTHIQDNSHFQESVQKAMLYINVAIFCQNFFILFSKF
jgi:hypothetical protein